MAYMNNNRLYIPISAQEYIKNQFKDKVTFEVQTENTVAAIFEHELNSLDITDIFFAGAFWGINKSLKTT
jgi:hypothetical protein